MFGIELKSNNRTKKRNGRHFVCLLLCAAFILSGALALASCSFTKDTRDVDYVKIEKGGEKISVKAPVYDKSSKKDIFLFAIDLWQSKNDLGNMEPVAKAKISGDNAKAKFKVNDNITEMMCKGYIFARYNENADSYTAISDIYYVTNPLTLHEKTKVKETDFENNFKGAIGTPSELSNLGASSTCITVDLSKLIAEEGGDDTVSYMWNGLTYHSGIAALAELDRKITSYTQQGIYVFLEIIQTKSYEELPLQARNIAFPSVSGADSYALNMTNRSGSNHICAMLNFLADRYSEGEHGIAKGFIIGNKVNSMGDNFADGLDAEGSITNYVKAVRAAYNILLSHNPCGKVYISLGNNWNVAETGGITAREMLSTFNNIANAGGDFFWQVAIEANASDASNSEIWNDELAGTEKPNFLSLENIQLLTMLLNTSPYMCWDMNRHVLVNRFVVSGADEKAQAASYAYGFYKCFATEMVDAVIYGVMNDTAENTLKNGLMTMSTNGGLPEEKQIAKVFRGINTKDDESVSFVSKVIGKKWDKIYEEYARNIETLKMYQGKTADKGSDIDRNVLTNFTKGDNFGFKPVSAAYPQFKYSEAKGKPAFCVKLSPENYFDMAGVSSTEISRKSVKKAGFLNIDTFISSGGTGANIRIEVSGFDKKDAKVVYSYASKVKTNVWTNIFIDIQDAVAKIKSDNLTITILAGAENASEEVSAMWLSEMTTEAPVRAVFPVWAIVLIVASVAVAAIVGFIIWFNKNYTFVREE